jgi:cysteine synthase A
MSAGNSPARARMLEGLGAEVVLVPQVDGQPGQVTGRDIEAAAKAARELARQRQGFYVDQFHAVEGILAHELTTGPEILRQLGRPVDAWVSTVGTGCTFMGVARALKAANPATVCAAVEPQGCRPLAGEPISKPKHILQGTGYGLMPPHWEPNLMDLSIPVTDEDATRCRGELARKEGLYVGFTAAANVCAAVELLRSGRLGADAVVATVLCDTGLKY